MKPPRIERQFFVQQADNPSGPGGRSVDRREVQPLLRDQRILVIGGATGTGLEFVKMVHTLGAEVVATTRSQQHYDENVALVLGQERIEPLIADLTNHDQFATELDRLVKQNGFLPTAIVHSAAAGMDNFSRDLIRELSPLRRVQDPVEREEKLAQIRERVLEWVLRDRDFALDVNFHGHRNVVETFKELVPSGAEVKVIDWSSIWTDLGKMHPAFKDPADTSEETGVDVPAFYVGVAGSKGRFVRWLHEHAGELGNKGIYPAIVSGHLIADTDVGKLLDRYIFSLLPEEQQAQMREYFITTSQMVNTTIDVMTRDPQEWQELPYMAFVVGGRPVTSELSPNDPIFDVKLPL